MSGTTPRRSGSGGGALTGLGRDGLIPTWHVYFFQFKLVSFKKLNMTGRKWENSQTRPIYILFLFLFLNFIFLYLFFYFYYIKINIFHKNKNIMNFYKLFIKNIIIILLFILKYKNKIIKNYF